MTEPEARDERLGLLSLSILSGFDVRVVILTPGEALQFERAAWRDALIEVDYGELHLELPGGACRRFGVGALLWLDGLRLRALHNRGQQTTVLVAVSRPRPSRGAGGVATDPGNEKTRDRRLKGHDDHDSRPDRF